MDKEEFRLSQQEIDGFISVLCIKMSPTFMVKRLRDMAKGIQAQRKNHVQIEVPLDEIIRAIHNEPRFANHPYHQNHPNVIKYMKHPKGMATFSGNRMDGQIKRSQGRTTTKRRKPR